jgi:hypothetical protein
VRHVFIKTGATTSGISTPLGTRTQPNLFLEMRRQRLTSLPMSVGSACKGMLAAGIVVSVRSASVRWLNAAIGSRAITYLSRTISSLSSLGQAR